jgi:hypothetical protein
MDPYFEAKHFKWYNKVNTTMSKKMLLAILKKALGYATGNLKVL